MASASLKPIMEFFGLNAKDMIRLWKTVPDNATAKQRKTMLTEEDKRQIREGIENGSLTY